MSASRHRLASRLNSRAARPWLWLAGCLLAVAYAGLYATEVLPLSKRWQAIYSNGGIPDGYGIRGIDVSHYQGDIDWERVSHATIKGDPVAFCIIKGTEGREMDDANLDFNLPTARRFGLTVGAYHYFKPNVPAADQAANYISHVRLEPGDLAPVLDIEEAGALDTTDLREAALTWLLIVEDHYGKTPILYANPKFRRRYLNTPDFDRFPYWVAHYYVDSPVSYVEWFFWQHTDRGRLTGIRGFVDLDVFNGSMYALKQLCLPR
ncbi:MAG: glycoside hydrolase family 25 protein [Bacteroidaceae bacterium]|nr:glycoside hydrolase family 25 protein [Bacteroidaceae bacterium]